jgi:hypothetical protein
MRRKPFTLTRAEARELKRIDDKMSRDGGTPHAVVRRQWLDEMARELRRMASAYDGSPKKAKDLFEALLVAESEGVPGVAEVRKTLGARVRRRRAA